MSKERENRSIVTAKFECDEAKITVEGWVADFDRDAEVKKACTNSNYIVQL